MADEVNHYMQCERCGYRRPSKKNKSPIGKFPVYYHEGKPVYLDECIGCVKKRADMWRIRAVDKKP